MKFSILPSSLVSWASNQPDIQALALVGSHARCAAREDSDIDVIILTTEVTKYLCDPGWADSFGDVSRIGVENWGVVETLRVFYLEGPEVEFNFVGPVWASIPIDPGTRRVVSDGMKIMYDPHGILQALQEQVAPVVM